MMGGGSGMNTGNSGNQPRAYMGRVRGLRQGGRGNSNVQDSEDNNMAVPATGGKPPLGSGARFKNLVGQLSKRPGTTDPKRLAAFIGQRKYGASKMSKMAASGNQ